MEMRQSLWTVPRLTVAVDSSGTGSRKSIPMVGASNEPVPELPTATLDKPSACPQALGQAGATQWQRQAPMTGAGLPTLPTGTTATIYI